jgi:hypothetical protein
VSTILIPILDPGSGHGANYGRGSTWKLYHSARWQRAITVWRRDNTNHFNHPLDMATLLFGSHRRHAEDNRTSEAAVRFFNRGKIRLSLLVSSEEVFFD